MTTSPQDGQESDGSTPTTDESSRPLGKWRLEVEVAEQQKTAFPTFIGMIVYRISWLITVRFLATFGSDELAAASLANSIAEITGFSIALGLGAALTTLASQSRGILLAKARKQQRHADEEKQEEVAEKASTGGSGLVQSDTQPIMPLVYFYRGVFIQFLCVLPLGIWWLVGTESAWIRFGQTQAIASKTSDYLRVLAPGLWFYSFNFTLMSWLLALELADMYAIASVVALTFHIPFNMLYSDWLGLGAQGCALATVTFQIIQPLSLVVCLFYTQAGSRRLLDTLQANVLGRTGLSFWLEAKMACTTGIGIARYLALALPSVLLQSEWWTFQAITFMAGLLHPKPDIAVDALTISQSMCTTCFTLSMGLSAAAATRVGNLLGANDPTGAEYGALVNLSRAILLGIILGIILFAVPHDFFPSLFTSNKELIDETSQLIPLLSLYVVAYALQDSLTGIIEGSGRQLVAMPLVMVAYWGIAVPLAYYVVFGSYGGDMACPNGGVLCGTNGLLFSLTVGTWSHMTLFGIFVLFAMDWRKEASRAQERVMLSEKRRPAKRVVQV